MTSCVRILSTSSMDSSPSILVVSSDGTKILINCGEGCQRTFVEYSQRLSTITTICLCSLHHTMVGGLPGTILTTADTVVGVGHLTNKTNTVASLSTKSTDISRLPLHQVQGQDDTSSTETQPHLEIIGPIGTQQYIHSLRHFMRRDQYHYKIYEGDNVILPKVPEQANVSPNNTNNQTKPKQLSKKRKSIDATENSKSSHISNGKKSKIQNQHSLGFTIQSISFFEHESNHVSTDKQSIDDTNPDKYAQDDIQSQNIEIQNLSQCCVSFILQTPPIPGKFLIEKATELGVPKGPMYGQLKSGNSISFTDPKTGIIKHVQSSDVVEPTTPPMFVLILYYPTVSIAQQLFESPSITSITEPELVIHITSKALFDQFGKQYWTKASPENDSRHGTKTDHIWLPISNAKSIPNTLHDDYESPLRSANQGAYVRSLLCPNIYCRSKTSVNIDSKSLPLISTPNAECEYVIGQPTMEYTILPRSKRGFVCYGPSRMDENELISMVKSTGALEKTMQIMHEYTNTIQPLSLPTSQPESNSTKCELIFTGTASAVPCKHRNVTGMLLKQNDGRSIVLDIGEGTIGQLLRMSRSSSSSPSIEVDETAEALYKNIKAVWISHPHADHHLGLVRLLKDRQQHVQEQLLLIAPTPLFRFLDEYCLIDREIQGTYISIDCNALTEETPSFLNRQRTIQDMLGIVKCRAVPVAHCAHAYAVILDGTDFGTVVFSGDCRPSTQLAHAAKGADILIHESTFENGMEADAVLKKHSTIDEAIQIGQLMECKCIVLTHFSQRYSKIPPTPSQIVNDISFPIIFAYDYMILQPHTLILASKLTPALRLLFADDADDNDDVEHNDAIKSIGAEILSIPGVFADARLL